MDKKTITMVEEHGNIPSSLEYFLKQKINKTVSILDLGCGYGSLIYNLYLMNYKNVFGLDVNKNRIKKGKMNYPFIAGKIEYYSGAKIPFNENFFDVVLMFDVLEHIPDIDKFLSQEVYRVLKKNGYLIFQTPNKIINIPWEMINSKSFTKWRKYHCSLQTKSSLKRILREAGFENIVIEKNDIITDHNIRKAKRKMWYVGLILLYTLQLMSLTAYPNFWGSAKK